MPTRTIDLEVILGWVPEASGFLLTVLYNAPGDHDDYRCSATTRCDSTWPRRPNCGRTPQSPQEI